MDIDPVVVVVVVVVKSSQFDFHHIGYSIWCYVDYL